MGEFIREPRNDHGERERANPWWDRAKLSLNRRVAEIGNNAWCEEGVTVRRDDETEVHDSTEPDLVVFEAAGDVAQGGLAVRGGAALVDLEAGVDISALVLGEPLCVLGERRKKEVKEDGDAAGE